MSNLKNDTIPIGTLFSQEFFFNIPVYQRPFLWDDENLSDLIDDLIAAPRTQDYFLGTLVLHNTSEKTYDIVDGQQRLTALSILLAAIRDSPQLASSPNDQAQLQEMLVQPGRSFMGIEARNRIEVKDTLAYNAIVAEPGGAASNALPDQPVGPGELRYYLARKVFRERLDPMSTKTSLR